jgi:hypothetical protein
MTGLKMKVVVVALVVVVAVLGGFYGGYRFGQSNVSAASNTGNRTGTNNPAGGFNRNGGTFAGGGTACPSPGSAAAAAGAQAIAQGRITSVTATSMTITSGTCTVTVDFTSGTVVMKQTTGSTSDLQDSQAVTVIGTRQPDGSVKASTIAIGNGFGRPGGASPSPSS